MKFVLMITAAVLYITSVKSVTNCIVASDCKNKVISDDQIDCQASNACTGSTLTASDTIDCSSDYACSRAISLTATNDINCLKTLSCEKASIESTNGDVYCSGGSSCRVANINAQNIDCSSTGNSYTCSKAVLNAVNDIILGSKYASYQTEVIAGGDIYVTSTLGAYYGRLTGTNIYINADRGAHQSSRLKARNSVLCIGESACKHGKGIISLGNNLEVTFDGLHAGGDVTVTCPPSGTCKIICANQGCIKNSNIDTIIIYTPGGTQLTVDPPECSPTVRKARRPDTCPAYRKKTATEVIEMIQAIDAQEFSSEDNENIVKDDFMAYIGVELDQDGIVQYGLGSYIGIGLSIMVVGVMVIGVYTYRKNGGNKYQIIE